MVSRVVAVANQKGGVAKTTTVATLGVALAERGVRVLLVDLDAQACLSYSLAAGLPQGEGAAIDGGVHAVLLGTSPVDSALRPVGDRVDLLPATIDLSAAERDLLPVPERERALASALAPVRDRYDVVLLDCSPSLGVLTLNALAAADEVIVPLQCEMLSHRGVGQLLATVDDARRLLNPRLRVRGLLPTMFDGRTGHGRAVLADIGTRYGVPVLTPAIPRSVRFAEAPAFGTTVLTTAPRSRGASAYRELAVALMRAWRMGPRRRA